MDSMNNWEGIVWFKGLSYKPDMNAVIIQFDKGALTLPVGAFLEFLQACSAFTGGLIKVLLGRQNEAKDIVSDLEDYLRQERNRQ